MTKFGELTFGEVIFGEMTTVGEMTFGKMTFGDLTFGKVALGDLTFGEVLGNRSHLANLSAVRIIRHLTLEYGILTLRSRLGLILNMPFVFGHHQ